MHPPFSVIFCGTPEFAIPALRALSAAPEFSVDLVITQPDKPVGRKQQLTPPPVKAAARELGLPVEQPEDINSFQFPIPHFQFLVTVAYGQIIGERLLALPSIAPVNVHPSLLPRWRGAAPIQNALLADDAETGVTIQRMVRELDAGDILGQESVRIAPRETAESLHEQLAEMAASLLVETLKKPLRPEPQDNAKITLCRKLSRRDGIVNSATMTAQEIDRRVRALMPWPGVTCVIGTEEAKLHQTSLEPSDDAFPVPCRGGTTLFVQRIQSPGKNVLRGNEWMRGHGIS
ncbi:MAG: methionyl-tRNA formyltransferase [Candidatus Peribacteraceae bacterium]|nr:methionyl-tRNA formyltransferase [Candidatus Peribacteraceae bacterium]